MSQGESDFERQYVDALSDYLRDGDEEKLASAFSMGRAFISSGQSITDLVGLHRQAFAQWDGQKAVDRQRADDFLSEALAPFDLVLRGYQEANQDLKATADDLEARIETGRRQLADTRTEYERLIKKLPGIFYTLKFGRRPQIQFISHQVGSILGFPPEDWTHLRWGEQLHADDRQRVYDAWHRAARLGESYELEYRIHTRDGGIVWLRDEGTCMGVLEAGGADLYGMIIDITARKELEEQFLSAQKMEAIARLTSGITHEFKNLLCVILAYSQIVRRELGDDSPLTADMDEILGAGKRADDLTRQMLGFVRQKEPHREQIDLNDCLASSKLILGRLLHDHRTAAQFDLNQEALHIMADPTDLEQILLNLVLNARDATTGGGSITVGTTEVIAEELGDSSVLDAGQAPYPAIYVRDTGEGIEESLIEHLFEPFFTTKPAGRGTGLGLPTSRRLARRNGGDILVVSRPQQGSCFTVAFPQAPAAQDPEEFPFSSGQANTLSQSIDAQILLVDDESSLRRVLARQLKAANYKVWTAGSAEEAYDVVAENNDDLHLLVTDIVLPQEDGFSLARRLGHQNPGLRILYMSAYRAESIAEYTRQDPRRFEILEKPFTPDEFLEIIDEITLA